MSYVIPVTLAREYRINFISLFILPPSLSDTYGIAIGLILSDRIFGNLFDAVSLCFIFHMFQIDEK